MPLLLYHQWSSILRAPSRITPRAGSMACVPSLISEPWCPVTLPFSMSTTPHRWVCASRWTKLAGEQGSFGFNSAWCYHILKLYFCCNRCWGNPASPYQVNLIMLLYFNLLSVYFLTWFDFESCFLIFGFVFLYKLWLYVCQKICWKRLMLYNSVTNVWNSQKKPKTLIAKEKKTIKLILVNGRVTHNTNDSAQFVYAHLF